MKYIIAKEFTGYCITTVDDDGSQVHFSNTLYNEGRGPLTFEEYARHPEVISNYPSGVRMVDWDELCDIEEEWLKQHYTGLDPAPTSEEEFNDMLEVLPPLKMGRGGGHGQDWFLMSEFTRDTITAMYAERDGRYLKKQVDATDRSTWIRDEDFKRVAA